MPSKSLETNKSNLFKRIQDENWGNAVPNEPLSQHTTLRIGGPAEFWFEPHDSACLAECLKIIYGCKTKVMVLGGGSNCLIPDEGIEGIVIHLASKAFQQFEVLDNGQVRCGAGLPLGIFIKHLIQANFGECEFLGGIPAQVGGAIAMNAGSGTQWVSHYLTGGEWVTPKGDVESFDASDLKFAYRNSNVGDAIITQSVWRFPQIDAGITQRNLREYTNYRMKTQNIGYPNSGCMFMNPDDKDKSAGQLIDEAGLKGFGVGRASISKKHANFVTNQGGATYDDVIHVMQHAQKVVNERFNVMLKQEMKVYEARIT